MLLLIANFIMGQKLSFYWIFIYVCAHTHIYIYVIGLVISVFLYVMIHFQFTADCCFNRNLLRHMKF